MNLPIKKYVIIGSYPLNIRFSKDIDVICYKADVETEFESKDEYSGKFNFQGKIVELLFADHQESFQQILKNHNVNENAWLWELWAIKAGHITYPHKSWDKHMHDMHIIQAICEPQYEVKAQLLKKLHKKSTEQRLGAQRLPSLKGVTKDKFFDDAVVKYYVHDDIHKAMAHRDRPMYEYMQHDTSIVECDRQLWDAFPAGDKVKCVLEECYVIALERHVIPTNEGGRIGLKPFDAFKWALMRVCTTLCSGWFRQYAIDNYFTILNSYDPGFVEKFYTNIKKYKNEPVNG